MINRKGMSILAFLSVVGLISIFVVPASVLVGGGGGASTQIEIQRQIVDVKPFAVSRFLSHNLDSVYIGPRIEQTITQKSLEVAREGKTIKGSADFNKIKQSVLDDLEGRVEGEIQGVVEDIDVRGGCEIEKSGDFEVDISSRRQSGSGIGLKAELLTGSEKPIKVSCDSPSSNFTSYFSVDTIEMKGNRLLEAVELALATAADRDLEDEGYRSGTNYGSKAFEGLKVNVRDTNNGLEIDVEDTKEDNKIPTENGYEPLSFKLTVVN